MAFSSSSSTSSPKVVYHSPMNHCLVQALRRLGVPQMLIRSNTCPKVINSKWKMQTATDAVCFYPPLWQGTFGRREWRGLLLGKQYNVQAVSKNLESFSSMFLSLTFFDPKPVHFV
ncbi:hypothetical protein AMELA_G00155460 [Ameiurus melas]|uniref:Uncharacterized protein n=1 Tax=Ameiurus melas TaxID=219545 RepID=A0A7J6ADE9_AMEME|nr:hypothetical protein AMELA_G00155460 [Ameiurus melas]